METSARLRAALTGEQGRILIVWAIFAAAAVVSVVFLGYAGRGQTLKGDEFKYAHRLATEPLVDVLLDTGQGKYLLVAPMLIYKAMFATIGIEHYLPYRLLGMALNIATAGLFLLLAARRVGYIAALPGAVLILFLGSSSEVIATPLRVPGQIAMVCGLAMLLMLERRDLRGDLAACGLLLISITSHPLGAAFAAAAAVLVLARPGRERWQRAWIFVVPLVAFGAWYAFLREPAVDNLPLSDQLGDVPRFEFQSLATMVAAVTGVFRSPFTGHLDFLTSLTYALAMVVLVVVGLRALATRLPATFWAILAAVIVLFAAPAFAPGVLRSPTAPRYILPGVIMLLLLLFEAFRGVEIRSAGARLGIAGAVAAVFALAVYSNAIVLNDNARLWAGRGTQVRAEMSALDLAVNRVPLTFNTEDPSAQPPVPDTHAGLTAGRYFTTKRAYGSPAFSPSELQSAPIPDREVADIVLARALGLRLRPIPSIGPAPKVPRPQVLATDADVRDSPPGCVTLIPGDARAFTQIELPRGGATLSAAGADVRLALGRFGTGYDYPLRPLQGSHSALLVLPSDEAQTPWRLLIRAAEQPVMACGIDPSDLATSREG